MQYGAGSRAYRAGPGKQPVLTRSNLLASNTRKGKEHCAHRDEGLVQLVIVLKIRGKYATMLKVRGKLAESKHIDP
eukprot:854689-Pelagomonas_calceolata.AAC.8